MDESLLRAVNGWAAQGWVGWLGVVLSSRLMIPLVCGPLALWLFRRQRFAAILSIALAMGGGDLIAARIMKPIFARERPCRALSGLVKRARCGAGKSFPSGHATVSFAFLFSAAPTVRLGWLLFGPIAASIAGSRVLLGVHYPTDIAAGAGLGAMLGGLAHLGRRRHERRKEEEPEASDARGEQRPEHG